MKFLYIAFSAAYCGFIFWLSHQSEPPKPDLDLPLADKAVHFALFGGLAALVSLGMHYSARAGTRAHFFAPVLFALLYGVSDEVHQAFIPMRQPEVWDVVADTAGALTGQALLWRFWKHPWPLRARPE